MNNNLTTSSSTAAVAIDFKKLLRQERQRAREEQRRRRRLEQQQQEGEKESTLATYKKDKENNIDALPPPVWNHAHLRLHQSDNNDSILPLYHRLDTKRHVVCSSNPSSIYYISNFISTDYQKALTEWLMQLPENTTSDNKQLSVQQQEERAMGCWTTMTYAKRRVALFDNRPTPPPLTDATASFEESRRGFPEPLTSLAQHISNFMAEIMPWPIVSHNDNTSSSDENNRDHPTSMINHILINDYCFANHQGILPHTDGPAYHPLTATLSLESSAILHFSPRPTMNDKQEQETKEKKHVSVLLEPGSLVIFHNQAYSDYLHSIRGKGSAGDISSTSAENENVDDYNMEVVTETCVNAKTGKIVERGSQRISLTFRIKKQ